MEWLPPGGWILFVRGASIVRGEGRRPDEEECGFGGVDVRSLLRLPAAAQCPAALGKRGPPLVELAPLPPSCLSSLPAFSFAPSASHLQGALAYVPSSRAATPAVRVRYLVWKDRYTPGVPSSVYLLQKCPPGCYLGSLLATMEETRTTQAVQCP